MASRPKARFENQQASKSVFLPIEGLTQTALGQVMGLTSPLHLIDTLSNAFLPDENGMFPIFVYNLGTSHFAVMLLIRHITVRCQFSTFTNVYYQYKTRDPPSHTFLIY